MGTSAPSTNPSAPRAFTRIRDAALRPIRDKVLAGQRLSFEDGVALYRTHDLLSLASLANHVREARHGDAAYFVWNTRINHTNVCAATCDFCAFAAKRDEPRAYTMGLDDIFANVAALPEQVREVDIVGGLHPDLPWAVFTDMMRGIKRVWPDIHVKAFTAVEIFFFHRPPDERRGGAERAREAVWIDAGGRAEIFARGRATRRSAVRSTATSGGRHAQGEPDGDPDHRHGARRHIESWRTGSIISCWLRVLQDETGGS